jgi:membrane-associated phospholipid phosphatase
MQDLCKKKNIFCFIGRHWLFSSLLVLTLGIWVFNLNQPLFYAVNQLHTIAPTAIWNILNNITYTKYGILPIILVILTFLFKRNKLTLVILVYLINLVVLSILKSLIGEPRPFVALPPDTFFWLNSAEDAIKTAYKSFPSGHVGNASVFVFIIIHLFFKKQDNYSDGMGKFIQIVLFLFVVAVGFSRICTGWHWPLDVLCAGLISFVIVEICFNIVPAARAKKLN